MLKIGETYTLHEVTPPAGYANADDIKFVLTDKGEIVINDKVESAVVMRDAKLQIKVSKKDITDTDELPGAVLQILDKADNSVIAEWKTADKPVIITEKTARNHLLQVTPIFFTRRQHRTVMHMQRMLSLQFM